MPMTYKHSGKRIQVVAASARVSGHLVADTFVTGGTHTCFGIAQANAATAEAYWVETNGVHNITVPGSTIAGVKLYAPGNAGTTGASGPNVSSASTSIVLTATSTSNTLVAKTITAADSSNKADCIIYGPGTY